MKIFNEIKKDSVERAVAIGYFDGVHIGHSEVITETVRFAAAHGIIPTVLTFNFNNSRPDKKNSKDLISKSEKQSLFWMLAVAEYYDLDFDIIKDMNERDFFENVLAKNGLNAKAIFVGDDFKFGKDRTGNINTLKNLASEKGIVVEAIRRVERDGSPVSTTRIKQAILEGDIDSANSMLGYNYGFCEPVIEGKQEGRKLGFATANQALNSKRIIPKYGVYVSKVFIHGQWRKGITNIGVRPTYHNDGKITAETHIIGFFGDLYGEMLTVELIKYLRPEKKFESIEQLKQEVLSNIEQAKKIKISEF